jgi:hypothetical protein
LPSGAATAGASAGESAPGRRRARRTRTARAGWCAARARRACGHDLLRDRRARDVRQRQAQQRGRVAAHELGERRLVPGGQVRIEGTELVTRAADGTETREPIAADAADAARPADFFAFVHGVLETLREKALAPSDINLWPEHFDVAFDDQEVSTAARRATSSTPSRTSMSLPGCRLRPARCGTGFTGAEAPYDGDAAAALAFLRERRDACRPSAGS